MAQTKKKVSDFQMFDQNGIHKITGTRFDASGYDSEGYDKYGNSK